MNTTIYLVVEPIEIIAADLAMNVQDFDPRATVLTALSQEAACALLEAYTSVRLAFIHADPKTFAKTSLARALDVRGAQVAFYGDAAERSGEGILVLQWPFTTQTTAALLRRTQISGSA